MRNVTLGLLVLAAIVASYVEVNPDQVVAAAARQHRQASLVQATGVLTTGALAMDLQTPASGAATTTRSGVVKVLMLMCDNFGTNYNWVRDVQETYGWDVTTAALQPVVANCYYGGPMTVDTLVSEVSDVAPFDCLAVMMANGASHSQLMDSPEALALVAQADSLGLLLVGFCAGTRVLAAADVVEGHRVTGATPFLQEYLDAGAIWAGEPVPPVLDGNILTSTRNQTNAWRVCEIMRSAIDSLRAARESR
ncbi:MAG: DJ-1/PfpI family protein [bacterium]